MIVLSAELRAKPGHELELEEILRGMIAPVSAENGTISYSLHRARDASGRFFFYEKYRDQAAFDFHMATPYLKDTLARAEPLLAEAPRLNVYEEVASIAPSPAGDQYYVIESVFKKPFEEFGDLVPKHRAWLQQWYEQGALLCSGPKADRSGGVIIGRGVEASTMQAMIDGDPYRKSGVAEYQLKGFSAVKKARCLE